MAASQRLAHLTIEWARLAASVVTVVAHIYSYNYVLSRAYTIRLFYSYCAYILFCSHLYTITLVSGFIGRSCFCRFCFRCCKSYSFCLIYMYVWLCFDSHLVPVLSYCCIIIYCILRGRIKGGAASTIFIIQNGF